MDVIRTAFARNRWDHQAKWTKLLKSFASNTPKLWYAIMFSAYILYSSILYHIIHSKKQCELNPPKKTKQVSLSSYPWSVNETCAMHHHIMGLQSRTPLFCEIVDTTHCLRRGVLKPRERRKVCAGSEELGIRNVPTSLSWILSGISMDWGSDWGSKHVPIGKDLANPVCSCNCWSKAPSSCILLRSTEHKKSVKVSTWWFGTWKNKFQTESDPYKPGAKAMGGDEKRWTGEQYIEVVKEP